MPASAMTIQETPETEENRCAEVIRSLGFDAKTVTEELERHDYCFAKVLAVFLNGGDATRENQKKRFRRHLRKKVVCGLGHELLASQTVRQEYAQRAQEEFVLRVRVVDLGQHAGPTTGACFWLCLAGALSTCGWELDA